jgi:hypothetical protein
MGKKDRRLKALDELMERNIIREEIIPTRRPTHLYHVNPLVLQ